MARVSASVREVFTSPHGRVWQDFSKKSKKKVCIYVHMYICMIYKYKHIFKDTYT